ncbi:hypothetical protein N5F07_04570 [Pseudomonas chengduensis]|nr:hypothetical protein [Pseudomonas chengduensis]MDH1620426.1 hypothetical protein [Pseudomonas chengduensis]MDH1866950.1 hypothetical protein [Pseudomonas chengduensis]
MTAEAPRLSAADFYGDQAGVGNVRQVDPASVVVDGQVLDEAAFGRDIGRQFDAIQLIASRNIEAPQTCFAQVQAHVGYPQAVLAIDGDAQRCIDLRIVGSGGATLHRASRPGLVAVAAGDFDQLSGSGRAEGMNGGKHPVVRAGGDVTGADRQFGDHFQVADLGSEGRVEQWYGKSQQCGAGRTADGARKRRHYRFPVVRWEGRMRYTSVIRRCGCLGDQ